MGAKEAIHKTCRFCGAEARKSWMVHITYKQDNNSVWEAACDACYQQHREDRDGFFARYPRPEIVSDPDAYFNTLAKLYYKTEVTPT